MEPKNKTNKQIGQRDYPPEIENLWNDLILLYEKRIESDPKFSFWCFYCRLYFQERAFNK